MRTTANIEKVNIGLGNKVKGGIEEKIRKSSSRNSVHSARRNVMVLVFLIPLSGEDQSVSKTSS